MRGRATSAIFAQEWRWPVPLSRGRVGNQFGQVRWGKLYQHHPELGRLLQCLRSACRYLGADGGD